MEDFLKKLNYTQTKKHRYTCYPIRYFQKIDSYEFINIGIFLVNRETKEVNYKLILEKHLKKLHNCNFFNIEKLENAIYTFKEELETSNLNIVMEKRYINGLDTSFSFPYQSQDDIKTLTDYLYQEMIAYKFIDRVYEDRLHKTKKKIVKIVETDFSNEFEQREEGLSVQIPLIYKKTGKHKDILIGSFLNSTHFGEIITIFNPKDSFDKYELGYINNQQDINSYEKDFFNNKEKIFLLNSKIKVNDYSTKEKCFDNIKKLASYGV